MKRLLISLILGLSASCSITAMELQPSYGEEKATGILISNDNAKRALPLTHIAAKELLKKFDSKSNVPCQTLCTYLDMVKNSPKGEMMQCTVSSALDQDCPQILTPLLEEPTLISCPDKISKTKVSPNGAFICCEPANQSTSILRYTFGGDVGIKHIILYDCAKKTTSPIALPGKNNYVLDLKFSKNSNAIYFLLKRSYASNQLVKWDITSQSLSCILDGLQNTIMSSIKALSADEKYIVINDENGCQLYDLETRQPVSNNPFQFNFNVLNLPKFKISPNNTLLAVQTSNMAMTTATTTLYDLLTQAVSFALPQNHRFGSFSPCNQKFLSCKDNAIYVWNTQTHTIVNKIIYTDAERIVGAKYISDNLLKVKYYAIDDRNQIERVALLNLNSKKGICIYDYSKSEDRLSNDGAFSLSQLVNIQCGKRIHPQINAELKCLHLTTEASTTKYTCEPYVSCSPNNEFFLTAKLDRAGFYVFDTHRRLTNGSSLESVLAALIALKQKNNNEPISNEIRALIKEGGNEYLKKIFAEPKPKEEKKEEESEYRIIGKQIIYISKTNKK